MLLLALETTCDETAAAVIDGELNVLASVVASQDELHRHFGGVVPEIASRAHVERILPVIDESLRKSGKSLDDLDAIAVATSPGLAGSLLVGLVAAKTLCVALDLPLVAVNHLHAHIYACRLAAGKDIFPCVGFVVSGGHSHLYHCKTAIDFELLGGTIDDAAGEAFDKVATLLGLPYPGGPAIAAAAERGNRSAFAFPRPLLKDAERIAFSFSGLKTAVRYTLEKPQPKQRAAGSKRRDSPERSDQEKQGTGDKGQVVAGSKRSDGPGRNARGHAKDGLDPATRVADVAASFQEAAVDCLVGKAELAIRRTGLKTLCVGGGVAANRRLRERLKDSADEHGYQLVLSPPQLCTDNAAMGAIAVERLKAGLVEQLDLDITPGLVR